MVHDIRIVRALSTAEWNTAHLGAAQFQDGLWHALIGIDEFRLPHYPCGAHAKDEARYGCYLGIQIYFGFIRDLRIPPFEKVVWHGESVPEGWVRKFYSRPLWSPEPYVNKAAGGGSLR
jgi:hypothetical protein